MKRLFNTSVLLGLAVLLGACSAARNCDTKHPYRDTAMGPALVAPEGLAVPKQENGLTIPELSSLQQTGRVGDCLLVPPRLDGSPASSTDPAPTAKPTKRRNGLSDVVLPSS